MAYPINWPNAARTGSGAAAHIPELEWWLAAPPGRWKGRKREIRRFKWQGLFGKNGLFQGCREGNACRETLPMMPATT
jgi:hypothetical protein